MSQESVPTRSVSTETDSTMTEEEMCMMLTDCYHKLFVESNCEYLENVTIEDHEGTQYRLMKPQEFKEEDGTIKDIYNVSLLTKNFVIGKSNNHEMTRSVITPSKMERFKMDILVRIMHKWNGARAGLVKPDYKMMVAQVNDFTPVQGTRGLKRRRRVFIFEDN